jgi:hypothetical protein
VSQGTSVATAPGTLPAGTVPRSPDAGAATVPTSAPGRLDALTASVRRGLAGTPGRMRVVAALALVATLAFGLGAGQAFRSASGALQRAGANAAQVVRVQQIHTDLSSANAAASNAFLVGGLEPAGQRARYDGAIDDAAKGIAAAAWAQPADGKALAALNAEVVAYTGGVEQARANNRQGLPVGAQYLSDASDGLRAQALPLLTTIVTANAQRVQDEFAAAKRALLWLLLPGVVALVVLAGAMVWLARRTHRYVNLPLAGATLAVLLGLVAGSVVLAGVSGRVDQVRSGPYAAALATAQARVAAFDAKADESLTLIKRGSGAAYEQDWQQSSRDAEAQSSQAMKIAGGDLRWADYVKAHEALRALDDGGSWERAVAAATSRSGVSPSSTNTTFDVFATASGHLLADTSESTRDRLGAPGGWLVLGGALGLLLGLLAAAGSWWAVSQRLQEYR